jgi:hypothetical protein
VSLTILIRALPAICMLGLMGCGANSTSTPAPTASTNIAASAAVTASPVSSPGPSPLVAAPCSPVPMAFDPEQIDLTGPWAGDDAGIYYLRQVESVVWWNGMSSRADRPEALGRVWNNVGRGEIGPDLTIAVSWADVPRGEILGGGTLTLRIEDDGTGNVRLTKTAETGTGFGNGTWTPCGPG